MATGEFDSILEEIIAGLPADVRALLEEIPVIVADEPSKAILEDLGIETEDDDADLCGLYSGVPLNERSVFAPIETPVSIHLFRGPIERLAGASRKSLRRQIRITLLHELGHHFGFDEEKLKALGYE
ncbi:MAG TPA: metallopeptidase family protein [Bdellovibrionales bacterium]|nr:metallopeptidase family protein [Bdellovibrionales bacterium]